MAGFNWQRFLDSNNISYVMSGKNVAKYNLGIKCPWCGDEDPSEHMGLNLKTGVWGCWRNSQHRGRKPQRLIMKLLSCGFNEANRLAGERQSIPASEWEKFVADLKGSKNAELPRNQAWLSLPREFRPIENWGNGREFCQYLKSRGFPISANHLANYSKKYDLRYCAETSQKSLMWYGRFIFPIYMWGELVTWTSRAIKRERLRYLSLTTKKHNADFPRFIDNNRQYNGRTALMSIKRTLFNHDNLLSGGRLLFITEGPFDAMKMDYFSSHGVRATCLFGIVPTEEQFELLFRLNRRFDKMVVMYDNDEVGRTTRYLSSVKISNLFVGELPKGVSDPGALTPNQVKSISYRYLS